MEDNEFLVNQFGNMIEYYEYENSKIVELIKRHDIRTLKDLTSDKKSGVLSREIIEKLFVENFLKNSIKSYDNILTEQKGTPDFRVEKNGKITLTVEVYVPSFTKKVVDASIKNKSNYITYGSTMHPIESKTISDKINKYIDKYPEAKQCIFLFFVGYLNEKNIMRAFYNFYGDTIHSNGALAHNSAKCYCIKEKMEKIAGFFFTTGQLNIRNASLEYQDVIFAHNPFCKDEYSLPFIFFNSGLVFQSYIQFLDKKPLRGEWWGNFLIRFYQNKYPNYLFLKNDTNYCKQRYRKLM